MSQNLSPTHDASIIDQDLVQFIDEMLRSEYERIFS